MSSKRTERSRRQRGKSARRHKAEGRVAQAYLRSGRRSSRRLGDVIRQRLAGNMADANARGAAGRLWRELTTDDIGDSPERLGFLATVLDRLPKRLDLWQEIGVGGGRTTVLDALIAMSRFRQNFIRPVDTWQRRSHNIDRILSGLASHLMCQYPAPPFMASAWYDHNHELAQRWFVHLGRGGNIRTADGLPHPLTRRAAHSFCQAPRNYRIDDAFLWADVHGAGGTAIIADALRGTPLQFGLLRLAARREFWLSVLRFFIQNPMLDHRQFGPVCDFLDEMKYGGRRGGEPAQPQLSMKRRTVPALLAQVDAWHRELHRLRRPVNLAWAPGPVSGFALEEGEVGEDSYSSWRISELLSGHELAVEGKAMRHCVASYAASCHEGHCAIFSMTVKTSSSTKPTRCVTIEVDRGSRQIRQVRGRLNRDPKARERRVLSRWAAAAKLSVPSYI
jgi:hypothetical protein